MKRRISYENAAHEVINAKHEAITRENAIANLKADLDAANAASKLLNDQGQQYWRAWQASKREVADLKNKLTDTEAADLFLWRSSAQNLHDDLLNAQERANYAESHPWCNLLAWVKRKLAVKRD